jgi:DNA-binding MarR family transcriptional regulator
MADETSKDMKIKEAEMPKPMKVTKTKEVPISTVQNVYYASKSHTEASRTLSDQYGMTDRAWRYAIRKLEERGFLEPSALPDTKKRDLVEIARKREEYKVKKPKMPPKKAEKKPEQFVMVTVWFRIDYNRIGAKGYHPFFLQGFYSRVIPRGSEEINISDMMNYVQDRLNEFQALVGYLEFDKTKYVEGIETEELDETHHHDNEFKYNYSRNPL